jgi:hypothetical protein
LTRASARPGSAAATAARCGSASCGARGLAEQPRRLAAQGGIGAGGQRRLQHPGAGRRIARGAQQRGQVGGRPPVAGAGLQRRAEGLGGAARIAAVAAGDAKVVARLGRVEAGGDGLAPQRRGGRGVARLLPRPGLLRERRPAHPAMA